MSKFILVCDDSDFGMDMLGEYSTEQEAYDAMLASIESVHNIDFDTFDGEDDGSGMFDWEMEHGNSVYWGDTWANVYVDSESHYGIFEV